MRRTGGMAERVIERGVLPNGKKDYDAGRLTALDHGVGAVVMDAFEIFGFDPVPLDIGVGIAFHGHGANEVFDENWIIVGSLGDMFFVGPLKEGVDF